MEDLIQSYIIPPGGTKGKLASGTSYPFGAKTFTEKLARVPQFRLLTLDFYGAKPRSFLLNNGFFPAFEFAYLKLPARPFVPNNPWSQSLQEIRWEIKVYVVLSEMRQQVREYMEREGWQRAVGWLEESWPVHGQDGHTSLNISFDNATGEFQSSTQSRLHPAH